ncbi:hypothetical protein [Corynebacterium renale]
MSGIQAVKYQVNEELSKIDRAVLHVD